MQNFTKTGISVHGEPFIPTNNVGSSSLFGVFVVYFSQKQSMRRKIHEAAV